MNAMRSLAVIPPWSAALVHGFKPVENRPNNLAGSWRGTVAILSSLRKWDPQAARFIRNLTGRRFGRPGCYPGQYIGTVDLVDAHCATGGCCEPWGEPGV